MRLPVWARWYVAALLSVLAILVVVIDGDAGAQSDPPRVAGYWIAETDGDIEAFGAAVDHGSPDAEAMSGRTLVDIEPTTSGGGYWVLLDDGSVLAFGDAPAVSVRPFADGDRATTISATPSGGGLLVTSARGCVQTYGDAAFYGSMCGLPLNAEMVDSTATPSGQGYWLLGRDGGVFSFGDAEFHGSTGGMALNAPVNGMAATSGGYWLVADDGGIFAFDAPFWGSMGGGPLNEPVVGMVGAPDGEGYLMVARDGGIFSFRSVPFYGSGVDRNMSDVVGVATFVPRTDEPPAPPAGPLDPGEGDGAATVPGEPWSAVFGATDATSEVVITSGQEVYIDADTTVGSVTVEPGGHLLGHPDRSFTFAVADRFVIAGTWSSRPSSCDIDHTWLNTYTGSWLHPGDPGVADEPGFYFIGETYAVNFARPCVRDPWGEVFGGLSAGDTSMRISEMIGGPSGNWQPGDVVVVHPSQAPQRDSRGRWRHDITTGETVTVTAVDGDLITFEPALIHDHPDPYGQGVEVHNLDQSVTMSGTLVYEAIVRPLPNGQWRVVIDGRNRNFNERADAEAAAWEAGAVREDLDRGRSHVMVMRGAEGVDPNGPTYQGPDRNAQTWTGVRFSAMGAMRENRNDADRSGAHDGGALGRYPLHFHRLGDLSRGTVLDRITVDDSRNHAVVVHASHGVTLVDVGAYKIFDDAFFWDRDGGRRVGDSRRCDDGFGSACDSGTSGITYDRVLAGHIRHQRPGDWVRLSAFDLGQGAGDASAPQRPEDVNTIRDSVAVDVGGGHGQSNGIEWPESANGGPAWNTWDTFGNEVHNAPSAFFVWQNTNRPHDDIVGNVAWHSRVGWFHGAYSNGYVVTDHRSLGNVSCVDVHAIGGGPVKFNGGTCVNETISDEAANLSAFLDSNHRLPIQTTLFDADGEPYRIGNAYPRPNSQDRVLWHPVEFNDWTVSGYDNLWRFAASRHPGYYAMRGLQTDTTEAAWNEDASTRGFCFWPRIGDDPRPTTWCPHARPSNAEIATFEGTTRHYNADRWLAPPLAIGVPLGSQAWLVDQDLVLAAPIAGQADPRSDTFLR